MFDCDSAESSVAQEVMPMPYIRYNVYLHFFCYYLVWKESAGKTKVHSTPFRFLGPEKVRFVRMPCTNTLATVDNIMTSLELGNYKGAARQVV